MQKISILVLGFITVLNGAAFAACPTYVPGDATEAIAANQARLLCLQGEINAEANRRRFELELTMQRNAIQTLQLQRRFDQLPKIEMR
jgi:hypothetical protein